MADYYTNFSLVLNLASKAEQEYALDLAHKASLAQQGDELPADFPKTLVGIIEDWQFETVADLGSRAWSLSIIPLHGVEALTEAKENEIRTGLAALT
jgi:hypothetical protein